MGLRVLVAGEEAAGAHILRALADADHTIVAVLSGPASDGAPSPVAGVAERVGTTVLPARTVRDPDLAERMRGWGVDVLLNAHSLHHIADEVLAAPTVGSFNLHPGPLPSYAGLNTVAWAIYNGEAEHGVTVHWMAPRIDAGPIAFEERFPIGGEDTALTVSSECTRRGVRMLMRVLERAAEDPASIPAVPQDLTQRTYYAASKIPADGRISWDRPATELSRLGRAFDYGPFPCPWGRLVAEVNGTRVEVAGIAPTGAFSAAPPGTVRAAPDGAVEIACRDEWVRPGKVFANGFLVEATTLMDTSAPSPPAAPPHPSQGAHS